MTIRALVKGEVGKRCKTLEVFLLSVRTEKTLFVLFTLFSELLVLFVGVMLGKCMGETVTVLPTGATESVELCWRGYETVRGDPGRPPIGNNGEILLELTGLEE